MSYLHPGEFNSGLLLIVRHCHRRGFRADVSGEVAALYGNSVDSARALPRTFRAQIDLHWTADYVIGALLFPFTNAVGWFIAA